MQTTRADHTATLLPNGTVLVAAGYNVNGAVSGAEVYNPGSGQWVAGAPLLNVLIALEVLKALNA